GGASRATPVLFVGVESPFQERGDNSELSCRAKTQHLRKISPRLFFSA
ncbi:MAG: hypothetical protein ACI9P8_001766, partial [Bacteroidia bacterium]